MYHYSILMFLIGNSKPTLKILQHANIITATSLKWHELGVELLDDNQIPQLDIIKANNNDVSRCCSEMFSYWLQTHPNANWYELVAALRAPGIELNDVAASVKRICKGW